jgi:hypothetical protein
MWLAAGLLVGVWAGGLAGAQDAGSIVGWGQLVVLPPSALRDLVAVAGGVSHSLGLKSDGSIVAWGGNNYGQCIVASPNTGFVAVAGGQVHSLGLKSDGSLVPWGDNGDGQCNVPAPNTGFVAVAGGMYHSLGLKSDGSLVAWGANWDGQCNVPAPNTGFVAVAGGGERSLGLKAFYGDLNCDGVVDFDDINPFVSALGTDPLAWNLAHPGCHWLNADCDADGDVDFDDISSFVALLSGS